MSHVNALPFNCFNLRLFNVYTALKMTHFLEDF